MSRQPHALLSALQACLVLALLGAAFGQRSHFFHEATASDLSAHTTSRSWALSTVPSTAAADAADDRSALADLFVATSGAKWRNAQNWLAPSSSMCSWFGVRCDNCSEVAGAPKCRVVALLLPNNKLVGTLPASIGNMSELTILNLNTNSLSGPVPESIALLRNLTYLDFGVRLPCCPVIF
jgi:hypothetical protein